MGPCCNSSQYFYFGKIERFLLPFHDPLRYIETLRYPERLLNLIKRKKYFKMRVIMEKHSLKNRPVIFPHFPQIIAFFSFFFEGIFFFPQGLVLFKKGRFFLPMLTQIFMRAFSTNFKTPNIINLG